MLAVCRAGGGKAWGSRPAPFQAARRGGSEARGWAGSEGSESDKAAQQPWAPTTGADAPLRAKRCRAAAARVQWPLGAYEARFGGSGSASGGGGGGSAGTGSVQAHPLKRDIATHVAPATQVKELEAAVHPHGDKR